MKIPQSIQERWQNLTPSDDFVFSKMMRNKAICKGLVETLLGFDIDRIEYPEEQKSIDIAMDAKSVRLDVYVKDDKDTVYNIEMQTSPQSYLPKRSRYYQGMIDLNLIEKGELYDKLNTSYVIFICTFDPFNKGRHVYHFENRCIDDPALALGDETHKCFFNTRGTDTIDPKLDQVLTFLDTAMPVNDDNPLVEAMSSELARIKSNTEWEAEFMNLYLRDKEKYQQGVEQGILQGVQQGMQQGEAKGKADNQLEIITRMLGQGLKTNDIFLYTGIPMDRITEVQRSLKKH